MAEIIRKATALFITNQTKRKKRIISRFCPGRSAVDEKKPTIDEKIAAAHES